jgi:shikimate dehydrogenase
MKSAAPKDVYTLDDLRSFGRRGGNLRPPVRLGVFGDPIAHSLSPAMQNAALTEGKMEMQYGRFHIRAEELREALQLIRDLHFVGVNLTVPHKIAALGMMDELDPEAAEIGAVNTIAVRDGRLVGFNTDAAGFARALRSEFSIDLRDLRVLLLGAGGAARAVAVQCARAQCERLAIVARDVEKAEALTKLVRSAFTGPRVLGPVARLEVVPWRENALRSQLEHTDLVVNATPLGLQPNDPEVLPVTLLQPHLFVFDTVYAARPTRLVKNATEAGARAIDGLPMLLQQGARAFEIWFQREAPVEVMRRALQSASR